MSEEDEEENADEFHLFDDDLERNLDAGYDRSLWGNHASNDDLERTFRSHFSGDDTEVSQHEDGWVSISPRNRMQLTRTRQTYEKILTLVHKKGYADIEFIYDSWDSVKITLPSLRAAGSNPRLGIAGLPPEFPNFLEDALSDVYGTEVRELEHKAEFVHTPHDPKTGEVLAVFTSAIERVPVPNGHGYHVHLAPV